MILRQAVLRSVRSAGRPPRQWAALRLQARSCSSHSPATGTAGPAPKPAADHRKLGVQQELFTTSIYSPGSPILLPHGARIFNRLVDFLRKQYVRYGFDEVITPTIYKKSLWAKSGHLENYADDMFTVTSTSPSRADSTAEPGEDDEYGLKPMNCPGHCLIFASQRRSYRDLPIRYADFSPLHRNEISGALSGMTRVRRFHQDDGHIFCRPMQIEDEIRQTLEFVKVVYSTFKLGPYRLALSTRPADHFIGSEEDWASAEAALRRALDASGQEWTVNEGDGAFYGPKIDIVLRDSDGKEHQTATIQLDFQLPKRFELEYQAPAPEFERRGEVTTDSEKLAEYGPVRPVLIHRAVLGSVERLMALLIEHYDGKYPFWLNPRQVMILTVNDSQPVLDLAAATKDTLLGRGGSADVPLSNPTLFAVDIDDSSRSLQLKLREAKSKGYGVIVTVGPRQVPKGTVTVDLGRLDSQEHDGAEKKKHQEMTPGELVDILKTKTDAYQ
ncbi:threonyl-tRNA synthetase [Microdochium nivale]|nr:threonyl-tRNA synthetase [Microdochium nivale]